MSQIISDSQTPVDEHPLKYILSNTEKRNDTIDQKVVLSDLSYKFEYGVFEVSSTDVSNVAKTFFSKSKFDSDILPPVTRWVSKNMSCIALERPPFSVNIAYDDIHFEEEPLNEVLCEDCDPEYGCDCGWEQENLEYRSFEFTLNIPWTIWFMRINIDPYSGFKTIGETTLFCSPNSIQSNESPLYTLPLPNLYDTNTVCWGNSLIYADRFPNFSAYVLGSINSFWTSRFNNDLISNIGSLNLGSYSNTRNYLELYSELSMDEVLEAEFEQYTFVNGDLVTFGSYCESINISESSKIAKNETSNKASKFFKDLAVQ